jgi:hypothetical protein
MSFVNAKNAAFRLTTFQHANGNNYNSKVRCSFEKSVQYEVLATDAINYPEARGLDAIDARATIEALDWTGKMAETTSAGNLTIAGNEAVGSGTFSNSFGAMKVCGYRSGVMRRNGGNPMAQDFELEGALTETITM